MLKTCTFNLTLVFSLSPPFPPPTKKAKSPDIVTSKPALNKLELQVKEAGKQKTRGYTFDKVREQGWQVGRAEHAFQTIQVSQNVKRKHTNAYVRLERLFTEGWHAHLFTNRFMLPRGGCIRAAALPYIVLVCTSVGTSLLLYQGTDNLLLLFFFFPTFVSFFLLLFFF